MAAHLYWRVRCYESVAGGGTLPGLSELEFRGSVGGADLATGGTAIAVGGGTAANAFDNSTSTDWQPTTGYGPSIGYQFASAVDFA